MILRDRWDSFVEFVAYPVHGGEVSDDQPERDALRRAFGFIAHARSFPQSGQ